MNINLKSRFFKKIAFIVKRLKRRLIVKDAHHTFISGTENEPTGLINAIYIINLKRQPDRWSRVIDEAIREKTNHNRSLADYCKRIDAIDGRKMDMDNIPTELVDVEFSLKDQYTVDPDPRLLDIIRNKDIWITMTREEIAVCLSHISCWKRIVEEQLEFALVMEDDIFFEGIFSRNLNQVWKDLPQNDFGFPKFDLLYLSYREVDWGAEIEKITDYVSRPIKGLWWLSGYVLSFSGAKKLLDLLPVRGPVDLWINLQFQKLDVYASTPSLIFQRNDLPSNNSYSIMPILSQIGIESDKTHMDLLQRKGRNPVFVITDNLSFANTLNTALSILGYRCCFDQWGRLASNVQKFIDDNKPLLFDAYIGVKEILMNYRVLESLYPNSVFIWLTNKNTLSRRSQHDFFNNGSTHLPERFLYDKKRHLVLNPMGIKDWSALCSFLQCKTPPVTFPIVEQISDYSLPQTPGPDYSNEKLNYLQHDLTPWIIPVEMLAEFGIENAVQKEGNRIGSFKAIINDCFNTLDQNTWILLEESFPSNMAEFTKENFELMPVSGFFLSLEKRSLNSRQFCSASIKSKASFLYGKFEVILKPVKADGVITAFFLHRNDPWQELDIEFLGKDTSKVLLNVYFNPGSDGAGWNFGVRGTPVLINLGFDASQEYHKYSIEWEPHEIRWLVDDRLIHIRGGWQPSMIPNQPMQVFTNLWPSQSEELAGIFLDDELPLKADVQSISICSWSVNIEKSEEKNYS